MRALSLYNLLALATCAGLGYAVYAETVQPAPSLPETTAQPQAVVAAVTPAPKTVFRMPPKNAFNQLATRPPFSAARRPPRAKPAPKPVAQKPQPAVQKPAVVEPQITLVGILINPQKSVAMVRKPGVEELLRLAKGEDLDGWRVEGVLPDRLLLSHGGKLLEFELSEAARRGAESVPERRNSSVRSRRQ